VIEGKRVLELVPAGRPLKEGAVERVVSEAKLDGVLYAGDDVADLRAFAALDRAAVDGIATVKVAVRGPESPRALLDAADVVVDGPAGLVVLLGGL
jgi:trehalose 6-phosphate phosphatase